MLKLVKGLWQTPSSLLPILKRAERKYYVLTQGYEYMYPPPGSPLASAVNKWETQGQASTTPKNMDTRMLDMFGIKMYSTARLQLRISNHQALLGRYRYNTWDSVMTFKESLPQHSRQEFLAIMVALDEADSAARSMALAVSMRHSSWLQCSVFSPEVQQSV